MSLATTQHSVRLGENIVLGRELARGGEGSIHEVTWLSGNSTQNLAGKCVAKKYFKPSAEKTAKLRAMLANVPKDPTRQNPETSGHISIAWPIALILDGQDDCVGFLMPYIDHKETFPLLRVYNPQDRRTIKVYNEQTKQEVACQFTWAYLLRMAYNLAEIVKELHSKGYVVGDLNESNILVTATALVTLVDCDSMQVPKREQTTGHLTNLRCPVGKPEYTPPELQGKDFSLIDRAPDHDNFGLAILIFLILMEGRHPFASAWRGDGPPPTLAQSIAGSVRETTFPYKSNVLSPPKNALPLSILPLGMQSCMIRCFVPRSSRSNQRPTAQEWVQALEEAEKHLRECQNSPLHVYSAHLKKQCPWCARVHRGLSDPFPSLGMPLPIQKPVPAPTMSTPHKQSSSAPLPKQNLVPVSPGKAVQAQSPRKTQPLSPQTQPLSPQTQPLSPQMPQLPKQQSSSAGKKLFMVLLRLFQLAFFVWITFLLYVGEVTIIYLVSVYTPSLWHNAVGSEIGALVLFVICLCTPIIFFLWLIKR